MNCGLILGGGLLAVTVISFVTMSRYLENRDAAALPPKPARVAMAGRAKPALTSGARDRWFAGKQIRYGSLSPEAVEQLDAPEQLDTLQSTGGEAETKTPRKRTAHAWENLINQVVKQTDVPADEQAMRLKEAFNRLDVADQMDAIRSALNLLRDKQFPALYAILYDNKESADVLDAIFSDALNRPEEIKNPVMRQLRKDRDHPLFFEASRILDVVEPKGG